MRSMFAVLFAIAVLAPADGIAQWRDPTPHKVQFVTWTTAWISSNRHTPAAKPSLISAEQAPSIRGRVAVARPTAHGLYRMPTAR
jgi:hypothetical protein